MSDGMAAKSQFQIKYCDSGAFQMLLMYLSHKAEKLTGSSAASRKGIISEYIVVSSDSERKTSLFPMKNRSFSFVVGRYIVRA
jgi:hypothetical protein